MPILPVVLLWLLLYPRYWDFSFRRAVTKRCQTGARRSILCEHTVRLTPDHLLEETALSQMTLAWAGVEKVEASEDYVFVYTGPGQAHIIPRRAFPDDSRYRQFYETAWRSWRDAVSSQPSQD